MLTLVPGVVGGSETYARELAQGARPGRRARVPRLRPDDRARRRRRPRRRSSSPSTAPRRSMPRPHGGDVAGRRSPPAALRRALRLDELDAIHFPLSVMLPPVDAPPAATTVLDVQHEVFPEFFSRAELAYRRRVYGWTVRKSRIVITISEHARRGADRAARARPRRACARSTSRSTTSASRPDGRAARALPALPRERLEAQEPRAAVRGVRRRPPRAARASGSSSPAPATSA